MKKYIMHNRHTLLASVILAFFLLAFIEATVSGRELFNFEIDNSFLQFKVDNETDFDNLEILEDFGINVNVDF